MVENNYWIIMEDASSQYSLCPLLLLSLTQAATKAYVLMGP